MTEARLSGHDCQRAQDRIVELSEALYAILKSHCRCPECRHARAVVRDEGPKWPDGWTVQRHRAALAEPCPHVPNDPRAKIHCPRCVELALSIAYAAGLAQAAVGGSLPPAA